MSSINATVVVKNARSVTLLENEKILFTSMLGDVHVGRLIYMSDEKGFVLRLSKVTVELYDEKRHQD